MWVSSNFCSASIFFFFLFVSLAMRRHDDYEAKSCPKAVTPRKLSLEKLFACGCCSSKRDSSSSATRSRSSAAGAAAERAAAARGRTYKSEEADAAEAGLEDVGRRRRCRRLGKQEAEKELKILNQKIVSMPRFQRVQGVQSVVLPRKNLRRILPYWACYVQQTQSWQHHFLRTS